MSTSNGYTSKQMVVCSDGRVRMADTHFSEQYQTVRGSVRVSGFRVTGTVEDNGHFVADPYLQNADVLP